MPMLRIGEEIAQCSTATETFLRDLSNDITVTQARALETGVEGLDTAIDYAQGDVFGGKEAEAYVIIRIVPG